MRHAKSIAVIARAIAQAESAVADTVDGIDHRDEFARLQAARDRAELRSDINDLREAMRVLAADALRQSGERPAELTPDQVVAWLNRWWADDGFRTGAVREYGLDVAQMLRGVAEMIDADAARCSVVRTDGIGPQAAHVGGRPCGAL